MGGVLILAAIFEAGVLLPSNLCASIAPEGLLCLQVRGISARQRVSEGTGFAEVQIRKGKGLHGEWARPFAEKISWVTVNWDRYVDSDDEDNPMNAGPGKPPEDVDHLATLERMASSMGGLGETEEGKKIGADLEVAKEKAHAKFIDAAKIKLKVTAGNKARASIPAGGDGCQAGDGHVGESSSLDGETTDGTDGDQQWLADWKAKFGQPQRMVTMADLWNQLKRQRKQQCALRLVGILRGGDANLAELEAHMKGGDVGSLTLDTAVYDGVARPSRWLKQFVQMEGEEQVEVMAQLFLALDIEEQKLVVATFM